MVGDALHPGVLSEKYGVVVFCETSTPSRLLPHASSDPWVVWDE